MFFYMQSSKILRSAGMCCIFTLDLLIVDNKLFIIKINLSLSLLMAVNQRLEVVGITLRFACYLAFQGDSFKSAS